MGIPGGTSLGAESVGELAELPRWELSGKGRVVQEPSFVPVWQSLQSTVPALSLLYLKDISPGAP